MHVPSPVDGRLYYVVTSEDGEVEQWELFDAGGRVDGRPVRALRLGSQLEGCVADDALARLGNQNFKYVPWSEIVG